MESCDDQKELNDAEEKWIAFFNAVESDKFYNIAAGGNAAPKTSEHKRHLSESWTIERKAQLSERVRGERNPSKQEAVRAKISENNSSHRPDIRKKLSIAKKGKSLPHTDEWNHRISEALKGRQVTEFTDELRAKLSIAKQGNKNPMYGKSAVKGSKWYNNGIINIRAFECPNGFVAGKVKHE